MAQDGVKPQVAQPADADFGQQHRSEILRLVLQTLQTLGYKESFHKLEQESGILLQSQHVLAFREAIIQGDWDEVINLLPHLQIKESSAKRVEFLIYQQKFLEFLEAGDRKGALECARTQLTPAAQDAPNLHRLTGLLMCKDAKGLYKRSGWDGKDGTSRHELLKTLHAFISSDQLLQENRLTLLLQQAQQAQRDRCLYHNVDTADSSLLQDHCCSRASMPQYTRCILRHHRDEVWFVAFSHSGRFLATAGKDQRCLIYATDGWVDPPADSETDPQPVMELEGHGDPISFLAWSPDDTQIVTCSQDATCRLWCIETGECTVTFIRHTEPVTAAAWYPDGKFIVSAALDKSIYKWDLTGKVRAKHSSARVNDICINKTATRMVTIDSDKRITNFNLLHPLDRLTEHEPVRGSSSSARERHDDSDDGTESGDEAALDIRDSSAHSVYKTIHKTADSLTSLCLANDGYSILVNKAINEKKGCIHLYDLRHRPFRVVQKFVGHLQKRFVIRSTFGGVNQAFVLSGSEDHRVYIYHRQTGKKLFALAGHQNVVNTVSWNPVFHHMFASGSDDGTVRIWTSHAAPVGAFGANGFA